MNRPAVRDAQGPLTLGKLLGRGGEGAVYEIVGRPNLAAKVYHQPIAKEKADKIVAMAAMRNDRLLTVSAWPLDLLRSPQHQPCGLVMPLVAGHKDIHALYGPGSRKVEFPAADWRFLIRAAANTARAFASVHDTNCIIGDVNHGSVRVSDKATVRLIDCDSFQVSVGGRRFLCEVGVPTFTPPELQGKSFRGVVRSPNHDNFGLAVLIFHLLFMGRHPFAGRFLGAGDMSIERAITEFRFAYGSNRAAAQMEPPPNVPSIAIASQPVALLLERAFSREGLREGVRPAAREWITALEGLEKQLKQCHINASHHFLRDLTRCPWCHMEAATGAVLFNFVIQRVVQGSPVDVAAIWAKIVAVPPPGPAPKIADWSDLGASPGALNLKWLSNIKKLFAYSALAAVVALLMVAQPGALVFWLLGGFIGWVVVQKWATSAVDFAKYREAMRIAEERWRSLSERWNRDASDKGFSDQFQKLERERNELHHLPQLRQKRYQELERNREHQQLRHFLERFEIDRATIRGIGPGRKVVLESYGIETAWDITEKRVLAVPGFGPSLTRQLLNWRQGLERKFRFDPGKGVDPQDIAALDREMADLRSKLEQSLANGLPALNQIRNHILAQRAALKPQLDEAARALAQARADLKAVE